MAFASPRALALAAALAFALSACSSGDNDDGSGGQSQTTTAGDTSSGGDTTSDAPTTDPSSSSTTSTTSTTSSTSTSSTSTTDTPTTTDPTDDTSSSDDTGPICDPGMANCVCDAGACDDGYVCKNDLCIAGLDCPGDVEPPGESEDTPVELGNISDDDDDFFEQSGVLSGASDIDWYHLHGADTFGHVAEPTLTLVSGTQLSCMFLECDNGGVALTTVTCPAGSDFAISPKLRPGCCSDASFTIKKFGCPGQDESIQMWARLNKPPADICSPYDIKIHF